MRMAYLLLDATRNDDPTRSVLTQAEVMAEHHQVQVISVLGAAGAASHPLVRTLVDTGDARRPTLVPDVAERVTPPRGATGWQAAWHARPSALVRPGWDRLFTALTDAALEAVLPTLDVDVVVSTSPGLLAAAVELTPDQVVVAHQDHRPSLERTPDGLLHHAPAADVVTVPTPTYAGWLRDRLGELAPPVEVVPDPLPPGFAPRSRLDRPVIMAAARLVPEKQLPKLVTAFAEVAEQLPAWRLRIVGEGPSRVDLTRSIRKLDLYDRVELVGRVPDLAATWAGVSVAAIASRGEGLPLGALQAMAAGVPVVAFDAASGARELVEHEVSGLLVGPESVAGLAAALLRICSDHDLRVRLGEGARRAARAYDAASIAERWVGVLGDARARRAGRPRYTARAASPARRTAPAPTAAAAPADLEVSSLTPAQARHDALAWTTAAARAASDTWFVIPAHEHESHVVVLPMAARTAFLDALGSDAPRHLCLREPAAHGWPERRGTLPELASELRRGRTSVLAVEAWPVGVLGTGSGVEVELWETTPDGDLTSPRRNPYADRVPADVVARGTVEVRLEGVGVPTLPLMAEPTTGECRFEVDAVYTWVDGSDPVWNAAREQRLAALTGTTAQTRESSGQARYLDRDELRYSLRSLRLFAPWVRRILLVTAGQVPSWLDVDHPGVEVVDHRELLPADGLPTFNSHAIETSLHRIPGLSEQFLYFNDDFLLARPVRKEAFFTPAGQNAVFFSPTTIGLSGTPDAPPFLKAAWNNRALLHERFGVAITHNLAHAPYPHRVSVIEAVHEAFPDVLAATARSPFRGDDDVATLSSLAQHVGLATGESYAATADLAYVNLSNTDVDRQLAEVLERDQDFVCLGDHHDHALRVSALDVLLADFYREYWPVPAPWERE